MYPFLFLSFYHKTFFFTLLFYIFYKEFYNEQASMVIDFCKEHKKVFHIKTGTITE